MIRLTAGSDCAGVRLDSFLAGALPEVTRSAAARQADAPPSRGANTSSRRVSSTARPYSSRRPPSAVSSVPR